MSTSRCRSLNATATEKWYRSWYSCLLLYLFAAALASSNNINPVVLYSLVYFCETVEHDEALSLLAHNGDGIRNIAVSERLDLVTNCLFLVSWNHLAEGTNLSSRMLRSLPSIANATDSRFINSASAVRPRESVITLSDSLPSFISRIAAWENSLLRLIPKEDEHDLWNQFLHGLTNHCFLLIGIPPSRSPQATALCRLAICPPLPSR